MLKRLVLPALVALLTVGVLLAPAVRGGLAAHGKRAASSTVPKDTILASYPGGNTLSKEIREKQPRADGYYHVDTPATIDELKALHVNTFLFLIWHSPTDWQDLQQDFMPAAQKAGINVWAYIVPPSECSPDGWCSQPYQKDYVSWARNIAQLSVTYPNLTGWAIDDFTNGQNSQLFTPDYMQQMTDAAHGINPKLGLYTVTYYSTATSDAFLTKYAPYIKGIIFPYRDEPFANTTNTASLPTQLDNVSAHAKAHGVDALLLIYTGRYSTFAPPTPDYARRALDVGMEYARKGEIQGIVSYGTPHQNQPAVDTETMAMYGKGGLVFRDYGGTTPQDSYESASQVVRVDPNAPRYTLNFWRYNRFYGAPLAGRTMQVLVDGHVVWSSDVSTDLSAGGHEFRWMQVNGPVEIDPSLLRGHTTATLTFRLYESTAAGFRSETAFDNLQTSGLTVTDGGFEQQGTWKLDSTYGNLIPSVDVFDEHLPAHVFQAVSDAFSGRS